VFTGIIEEVGTIAAVEEVGNGRRFRVSASAVLEGLGLGDSIAVDGVCQTVTALHPDGFEVQAVGTTLGRTTLGALRAGRRVNLERSMALGARLGGHLVQGHVDGVGEVRRIERRDELVLIDFGMPPLVADVTVLHGSIAVNGISMTVNALPEPGLCQLSVIPFTWDHTTFADLRTGDAVNLEGDMIGKFVRHMLGRPASGHPAPTDDPAHLLGAWGYTRGRES
jgi:riboflavin synthase